MQQVFRHVPGDPERDAFLKGALLGGRSINRSSAASRPTQSTAAGSKNLPLSFRLLCVTHLWNVGAAWLKQKSHRESSFDERPGGTYDSRTTAGNSSYLNTAVRSGLQALVTRICFLNNAYQADLIEQECLAPREGSHNRFCCGASFGQWFRSMVFLGALCLSPWQCLPHPVTSGAPIPVPCYSMSSSVSLRRLPHHLFTTGNG
ncbi:hypothetical protein ABBQ38_005638 [Trebouxia sp. C0009 RCD-2024]